jgi:HEAT repeat protein
VRGLAEPGTRIESMRALLGGVRARDVRGVTLADERLEALTEAVGDPDSRLRFWAVQVLDHTDDPRAVEAIVPALGDDVPKVRRNAVHALGCEACKPTWDGSLPAGTLERIEALAADDPNAKVRAAARHALECRPRSLGARAASRQPPPRSAGSTSTRTADSGRS